MTSSDLTQIKKGTILYQSLNSGVLQYHVGDIDRRGYLDIHSDIGDSYWRWVNPIKLIGNNWFLTHDAAESNRAFSKWLAGLEVNHG